MPTIETLALTLALATPSSSVPKNLWENVKAGMSQDAVKAAQPEAVAGEGYWCALTIPRKTIAGYSMKVCFGFPKYGTLKNVVLTQKGLGAYPDIVRAMTAKHGNPSIAEKCEGGLVKKCSTAWVKPGVSIEVARLDLADTYVTYKAIEDGGV